MDVYAIQLVLFIMIFIRCTTLLSLAPVLGHVSVPAQVKQAVADAMLKARVS